MKYGQQCAKDNSRGRIQKGSLPKLSKVKFKDMMTNMATYDDANRVYMKEQQVYYSANGFTDLHFSNIMNARISKGLSTRYKTISIMTNHKDWYNFIEKNYGKYQLIANDYDGLAIDPDGLGLIHFALRDDHIEVNLYGDITYIDDCYNTIDANFEKLRNYIKWVYTEKGDYIKIPLTSDKAPVDEMYPFLGDETLEQYYQRYLDSSANILLLIGPPGTGKTTFIRGLLQYSKASAVVTYNVDALSGDSIFADFVDSNDYFMIMEDADTYLQARTDGNNMMHRFLNVADGLVTTKNKKMIFSTNLASTNDIDSALIRPGRCFDILQFDVLNTEQTDKLAKRLGIKMTDDNDEHSIAQIFHQQDHKFQKSKIGFI